MKRSAIRTFLMVNLIVGINHGWAQEPDIGKAEYQSSCAACHGADGKGMGPVGEELKKKPADLTVIAKKNNGVFPLNAIYETIDGRRQIKSHGLRDMPVWGYRYMPSPNQASNASATAYVDPFFDPESSIRRRILSLIDYLYRIQEK